jgi:predicted transcriptional regulator
MTATVEHIRKRIDNLAPDESRELLLDLQRSFALPLVPAKDTEDEAEVETAWDAEIDARLQDVEQGRVRLLSAEESDERTEKLFTRLGIKKPTVAEFTTILKGFSYAIS